MADLVEVVASDLIEIDLRYASADNIAGRQIYTRATALLRPVALEALMRAARRAAAMNFRLRLYDAYRPIEAQLVLWDAIPDKRYVSDPARGGIHSRGVAVDLTLVDRAKGEALDMGTGFDAMTPLSAQTALDLSPDALRHRALLLGVMTACGWALYEHEWWHFHLPDYQGFDPVPLDAVDNGPM